MATNKTLYIGSSSITVNNTEYQNNTRDSCCSGSEAHDYAQIGRQIWMYGSCFFTLIGTIGNTISGAVVLRKKMRYYASSVYILALAIADTAMLVIGSFTFPAQVDINIINLSQAACKCQRFLLYWMGDYTSWILMSIAIERMVAVWWPLKVRMVFTRNVAQIQVTSLVIIAFLVNIHIPWTFSNVYTSGELHCIIPDRFGRKLWDWIDKIKSPIVPLLTIVICSVMILIKTLQARMHRSAGTHIKIPSLTFTLMLVCVCYIIFTMPLSYDISDTRREADRGLWMLLHHKRYCTFCYACTAVQFCN